MEKAPAQAKRIARQSKTVPRMTAPRMTVPRMTVPRMTVPRMTVPRMTVTTREIERRRSAIVTIGMFAAMIVTTAAVKHAIAMTETSETGMFVETTAATETGTIGNAIELAFAVAAGPG